jgi:3-oxoacyl-[acyl-carrier protein] reductase
VAALDIDLSDSLAIEKIRNLADQFGGADILINNAAIQGPIGEAWDVPAFDFDHTMRLNFNVPAMLCRALIPGMIARGAGWIVNISGGGATGPRPMFSAYGAAKTALVRFGETLAAESGKYGIRVNSVAPGAFKSGMTEAVMRAGTSAGETEIRVATRLLAEDSDAAERSSDLVRYLVAGEGRDVTGKLISAVWDDWSRLHELPDDRDLYTLRRNIVPQRLTA